MQKHWWNKNINWSVLLVGVAVFIVYLTTWHATFVGYEGIETSSAALKLFDGVYDIRRAGISAVSMYLPFIAIFRVIGLDAHLSNTLLTLVPVIYSALTAMLLYYVVWYLTHKKSVSVAVPAIIAICSSMWPYANIGMEYQAMFYITLLLFLLLRWKDGKGSLLGPAIAFALLSTAKSYGPMIGLPLVAFVALSSEGRFYGKKCMKNMVLVVLPAMLFFAVAMTVQYYMYHSVGGIYSLAYEFKITSWWEGFYGVFFSIGRGIFFFSPLLIITLFYWKKFYLNNKATAVFILLSFILLLLITAPFSFWTDETWTVRKLIPLIGLLHLPLIYLFDKKWSWKSVGIYFLLLMMGVSMYVQILGASYYYGNQLNILRQGNLDSLSDMRFVPQLSAIPLYNQLLVGYVTGTNQELDYNERTWFRWTAGKPEIDLHNAKISLVDYQTPNIVWLNRGEVSRKVFYGLAGVDILLLLFMGRRYFVFRRKEK